MKGIVSTGDEIEGAQRIQIHTCNTEDWVEATFVFYKSKHFIKSRNVKISVQGMHQYPGSDAGVVRRDFYLQTYEKLATGYLGIFKGQRSQLRPAFTMSNSASWHNGATYTSILMDRIGFPYFSINLLLYG